MRLDCFCCRWSFGSGGGGGGEGGGGVRSLLGFVRTIFNSLVVRYFSFSSPHHCIDSIPSIRCIHHYICSMPSIDQSVSTHPFHPSIISGMILSPARPLPRSHTVTIYRQHLLFCCSECCVYDVFLDSLMWVVNRLPRLGIDVSYCTLY